MRRPAAPTSPPIAACGAKATAAFGEVVGEEAAPLTEELATSAALDARDGPETFEGLATAEVADDGP
jgi:hypothetical protein